MSDLELSESLHRTIRSVKYKRNQLGLYRVDKQSAVCYPNLNKYFRRNITQWKYESMKQCNYKCIVTNQRFEVIHHLYSFNNIFEEFIQLYHIEKDIDVDSIPFEDRQVLLKNFSDLHNQYGLGVCLSEDIHKKFHQEYGFGNNTPEQFYKFLKQYNNTNCQ